MQGEFMKIKFVWEHNGNDSLLHAVDFVGAYTRRPSKEAAIEKMPAEIASYARWIGVRVYGPFEVEVAQEVESKLDIRDADTEAIFEVERKSCCWTNTNGKADRPKVRARFLFLYEAIPDKNKSCLR